MPMITDEDLEKEIKEGRKLILFGKERKVEQVPETFEEIKQLLHNDKKVFNKSVKKIEISEFMIEIHFKLQTICFLHSGDVVEPNCLKPIVTGRTPAQMWTIIKNLIGEE